MHSNSHRQACMPCVGDETGKSIVKHQSGAKGRDLMRSIGELRDLRDKSYGEQDLPLLQATGNNLRLVFNAGLQDEEVPGVYHLIEHMVCRELQAELNAHVHGATDLYQTTYIFQNEFQQITLDLNSLRKKLLNINLENFPDSVLLQEINRIDSESYLRNIHHNPINLMFKWIHNAPGYNFCGSRKVYRALFPGSAEDIDLPKLKKYCNQVFHKTYQQKLRFKLFQPKTDPKPILIDSGQPNVFLYILDTHNNNSQQFLQNVIIANWLNDFIQYNNQINSPQFQVMSQVEVINNLILFIFVGVSPNFNPVPLFPPTISQDSPAAQLPQDGSLLQYALKPEIIQYFLQRFGNPQSALENLQLSHANVLSFLKSLLFAGAITQVPKKKLEFDVLAPKTIALSVQLPSQELPLKANIGRHFYNFEDTQVIDLFNLKGPRQGSVFMLQVNIEGKQNKLVALVMQQFFLKTMAQIAQLPSAPICSFEQPQNSQASIITQDFNGIINFIQSLYSKYFLYLKNILLEYSIMLRYQPEKILDYIDVHSLQYGTDAKIFFTVQGSNVSDPNNKIMALKSAIDAFDANFYHQKPVAPSTKSSGLQDLILIKLGNTREHFRQISLIQIPDSKIPNLANTKKFVLNQFSLLQKFQNTWINFAQIFLSELLASDGIYAVVVEPFFSYKKDNHFIVLTFYGNESLLAKLTKSQGRECNHPNIISKNNQCIYDVDALLSQLDSFITGKLKKKIHQINPKLPQQQVSLSVEGLSQFTQMLINQTKIDTVVFY